MMQGDKEEDGEEKKEVDDDEKDMKGKGRDEEDMQESLVMVQGMMVKFPLVLVATFAAPASRFKVAKPTFQQL